MSNEEFLSKPLKVHSMKVQGNLKTKSNVILREFKDAWLKDSMEDVGESLMEGIMQLRSTGVFDAVEVFCDAGPENEQDSTNVTIKVIEKPALTAKMGSYIEGTDGELESSIVLRNLFGHVEKIEGSVTLGREMSNSFKLSLLKPHIFGKKLDFFIDLVKDQNNFSRYSSHKEEITGGKISVSLADGHQSLNYSAHLRDIIPVPPRDKSDTRAFQSSTSILQETQIGQSFKSSIEHLFKIDHRDDFLVPYEGSLFSLRTEFAGLGGDVKHLKTEMNTQYFTPIIHPLIFGISAKLGLLKTFDDWKPTNTPKGSRVSDRFFLGGPLTMRGFRSRGVGPRDMTGGPISSKGESFVGDALGGDILWNLGVALTHPLYDTDSESSHFPLDVFVHGFVNAGNLIRVLSWRGSSLAKELQNSILNMKVSSGVGLIIPTALGRAEINFVHILKKDENDRIGTKYGFQFGIGSHFL